MLKSIRRKLQGITDFEGQNNEITIELLRKGELSKTELDFLMKQFGNLKFFEEQKARLPLYLYTQIFKNLNYQCVNAYDTVFNYGDIGQIYYIIVKGEVCVLLPRPQIQEDLMYHKITLDQLLQKIENNKKKEYHNFNEYLDIVYEDFIKVRTLITGDTFGDYALITKSKRTATIICSIDSHFMTLHKIAFDRILYEHHNSIHKQQLAFFDNIQYLHGIPEQNLTQLIHQMIEIQPKLNTTIYQENEESNTVYFIVSGEIELSQKINNRQRIVISLMTKGAIFGELEILKNTLRTQKAICKSNETILKTLSAQQFISILENHNLKNQCSKQSDQITERQSKQIKLRRKATESLLMLRTPTQIITGLDQEITRFYSTRQISLTKRDPPITTNNCLFPIEIPHYIKLNSQKQTYSMFKQNNNNWLKNIIKTENRDYLYNLLLNIQNILLIFMQKDQENQEIVDIINIFFNQYKYIQNRCYLIQNKKIYHIHLHQQNQIQHQNQMQYKKQQIKQKEQVQQQKILYKELYKEEVLNLFYKQQKYMDDIMTYMLSGECVMFLLCHETENPIQVWKKMIGNKDPIEAKKQDQQCLRALYGINIIKNEFHGSDDPFSANKERDIFKFPIPQKIPDFKYDKMLVSLETLYKFLYPPNLEHSNALERLDIFAIYGPCVNYHSVDQCLCRQCAQIGKEHIENVKEILIQQEQLKLGIKIRPQLNITQTTKTQIPQRIQLPPIRLLKEEDISKIYSELCEKCQNHCNSYTHLCGGRNIQHIMTDQELNTLAKEMNKQEILELLYSEKGNAANVMIETIDLNEPNSYTKEMIELLFQELETDYYNRYKFYHLQNVILEDRRIRMNSWMSILINKPIHRFKNPKLVCKVSSDLRKNPESIHYTINRILPLNQTYKKKDITKMPLEFPPNLADKEKLNPNEEKLSLLKKLHRDTHHMVEIQDAKKVVVNGVYLLRKYNDGRNGEWDNYSSLKGMNRGSYVNIEEKRKKEKI